MNQLAESPHPSVDKLRTFGLGQLDEPEATAVEEHVSHCEACSRTLADVGSDTFIESLRQSRVPPADGEQTLAGVPADAAVIPPPELQSHPRYRVLTLLGSGGMGAVYKAEHLLMQRTVALKVMNRAVVGNAATVERFRREFRASALKSHPNIVAAYDAEQAGDLHFLVMEYVEGTDLARWVAEHGPMPVNEACDAIRQAARGLQHAHEHGMIHRDIKPHNLMLTANPVASAPGVVKILDFGLARLVADAASGQGGVTGQGTLLGTVDYLAPEQADDARQADIRSDIYSLGCTLYHLLTGQPPFPKGTVVQKIMAHTEREPQSLEELRPDIPPALARAVQRMMAKKPDNRFQTPAEVDDALAAFAGQTVVINPEGRRTKDKGRRTRRPVRALVLCTLAFVLLAAAGAVVYRIQTDKGELVITTESDDVEVVIKQGGKLIRIIDAKTDKEIKLTLRSGVYELELKGAPEGLKLSIDNATLTRGETVLAKIERTRPARELPQESSVLFNGKDLTGWVVDGGNDKVWRVENGELVGKHVDQIGYDPCWLLTEQSYSDFRLQLEFKLSSGTNSGVALRAVPGEKGRVDKTKPLHMEVQILDDAKSRRADGKVDSPTGSLFWNSGATYLGPEQPADLKPIGDWNEMVIESRGDTLQVWVNGRRLQNADLHKLAGQSDALPGLKRPSGRIGLQQHTGEVRFRNIEIRGVPDPPPAHDAIDVPPTPAPKDAVILFDGKSLDNWEKRGGGEARWKLGPGGIMQVHGGDILTKEKFGGNFQLHVEFRVPSMPNETGQRRGNSGVYVQGRYEVQILDSFGLPPSDRDCGAIYRFAAPLVNACKGPLIWQSYDIDFTAPVCKDGKKVEPGRLTVHQNGVLIHDNVQLTTDGTLESLGGDPCTPGPVMLQGLYGPVQFRNIWLVRPIETEDKVGQVHVFEGHKDVVQGIAVSADGKIAVSGGGYKFRDGKYVDGAKDYDIRVWDLMARTELRRLPGSGAPVWSVALSPDGKRVLSGGGNPEGAIRLLDAAGDKEIIHSGARETAVWSVAFSPDGRRFLEAADAENEFRLRDTATCKELLRFKGHTKPVRRAIFSDDGHFALSASYDGTARLWNIDAGLHIKTFQARKSWGWVRAVAISPDNRRILTAGDDKIVHVWDTDTGNEVQTLVGHKALINSVAISPDGRFALSGGGGLADDDEEDFSIRLWDLESGKELQRFDGHKDVVSQVIWLPDGKHALSSSWDTTVRLWRLPELPAK